MALGLPVPADAQTAGARMQPESDSSSQMNSSGGECRRNEPLSLRSSCANP